MNKSTEYSAIMQGRTSSYEQLGGGGWFCRVRIEEVAPSVYMVIRFWCSGASTEANPSISQPLSSGMNQLNQADRWQNAKQDDVK